MKMTKKTIKALPKSIFRVQKFTFQDSWSFCTCFRGFIRGVSWGLLGSPGVPWARLGSPGLAWAPLGSPGLPWAPLGSPGFSWAPLGPLAAHLPKTHSATTEISTFSLR